MTYEGWKWHPGLVLEDPGSRLHGDLPFLDNDCCSFQDSRVTVREAKGVVVLTVSAIDEDDAGQYQCVAENEAGSDQGSIFLSIIRKFLVVGSDIFMKKISRHLL